MPLMHLVNARRGYSQHLKIVFAALTISASFPGYSQGFGDLLRNAVGKIVSPSGGGAANNSANAPGADALQGLLMNGFSSLTGIDLGSLTPGTPAADTQGRVVLFRTSWCGYCKQAAAYMSQKGIPYIERDTENALNKLDYKTYGGKGGVPLMVFGDKTMSGFAPAAFDQAYATFKASQPAAIAATSALTTTNVAAANSANTGSPSTAAVPAIQAGDTLVGKLRTTPIYAQPSKTGALLTNLKATDQAVYLGEESNGLYRVGTPAGDGWGDKLMLKRAVQ